MRVGALAAAVGLMGLAVGVASSSPAGAATQTVTFDDHLCADRRWRPDVGGPCRRDRARPSTRSERRAGTAAGWS